MAHMCLPGRWFWVQSGINKFLDHFQIFPTYGETMEEKTKDSQCCTISKYWPYMEKMWKSVSVGQFFRYWPYMEKMSKETANKQY